MLRYTWIVIDQAKPTPARKSRPGARAPLRRGASRLGVEKVSKKESWTTIALPNSLFSEVAALVPKHAVSASEYCRQWIAIGVRIDQARASDATFDDLIRKVAAELRRESR